MSSWIVNSIEYTCTRCNSRHGMRDIEATSDRKFNWVTSLCKCGLSYEFRFERMDDMSDGITDAYSHTTVVRQDDPKDPAKGKLLLEKLRAFGFKLILNNFQKNTDEHLGEKIEEVCNRHFHSEFQFLGNVSYDERVRDSVLSNRTYATKYPYTLTALNLQNIADKLIDKDQPVSDRYQTYHEEI